MFEKYCLDSDLFPKLTCFPDTRSKRVSRQLKVSTLGWCKTHITVILYRERDFKSVVVDSGLRFGT